MPNLDDLHPVFAELSLSVAIPLNGPPLGPR
jgi:hypothetical protein